MITTNNGELKFIPDIFSSLTYYEKGNSYIVKILKYLENIEDGNDEDDNQEKIRYLENLQQIQKIYLWINQGKTKISLTFFKVFEKFDITIYKEFLIFRGTDDGNIIKLDNDLYVIGDKISIGYYKKYTGTYIIDNKDLFNKINNYNYNYNFFHIIAKNIDFKKNNFIKILNNLTKDELIQDNLIDINNKLKYICLFFNILEQNNIGNIEFVFQNNLNINKGLGDNSYKFIPNIYRILKDNSVIYIEIGKILNYFGLDSKKVEQFIDHTMHGLKVSGISDVINLFPDSLFFDIVNIFKKNITVIGTNQTNIIGLGIKIIIENIEIQDILDNLRIFIKKLFEMSKISYKNIFDKDRNGNSVIGYDIQIPTPLGILSGKTTYKICKNKIELSLFENDKSQELKLNFDEKSITHKLGIFYVNLNFLIQILEQNYLLNSRDQFVSHMKGFINKFKINKIVGNIGSQDNIIEIKIGF